MILSLHGIIQSKWDINAQNFIDNAGITNSTQQDATNTLTIDLKRYNLWDNLLAIYPFVGGTSSTHKFNLKDPQDTDAAYRLSFLGGWTHSSTGALPNGTNGYADTFLNPRTAIGAASGVASQISVYSRTNSAGLKVDIGHYVSVSSYNELILNSGGLIWDWPNGARNTATNTNTTGYYVCYNNSTNGKDVFRNNSNIMNAAHRSEVFPNVNLLLSQWGDNSRWSNHELAFVTIGNNVWDSTMASNLYTAVNTFQTTLSRNV